MLRTLFSVPGLYYPELTIVNRRNSLDYTFNEMPELELLERLLKSGDEFFLFISGMDPEDVSRISLVGCGKQIGFPKFYGPDPSTGYLSCQDTEEGRERISHFLEEWLKATEKIK